MCKCATIYEFTKLVHTTMTVFFVIFDLGNTPFNAGSNLKIHFLPLPILFLDDLHVDFLLKYERIGWNTLH